MKALEQVCFRAFSCRLVRGVAIFIMAGELPSNSTSIHVADGTISYHAGPHILYITCWAITCPLGRHQQFV